VKEVLLALLTGFAMTANAELRLPRLFADHMVLQRELPVHVWGWAETGETVVVTFAGQTQRVVADTNGQWRVTLAPMPAHSTGQDLVVTAERRADQPVIIHDVLVGEVWFTAGQSNMMMGLGSVTDGDEGLKRLAACPNVWVADLPGQALQAPVPQRDLAKPVQWARPGAGYSAVSGFFAEKLYRHFGGNVPVGIITAVAIVPAEAWVDAPALEASPVLCSLLKSPLQMTAKWFNGIIAPVGPYTIRGVLYYQGEYNGGRGAEFAVLFPALIKSWRTAFEQPNLPFLFVQLPGFIEHRAGKDQRLDMDAGTLAALHQPIFAGLWTDLREAQLNVWRNVPHTGMAVAIDLGEPYNIHPKQKEPVADRLLLSARQLAYGENVEGSSPVPAQVAVDNDHFIVTFEHVGGGLVAKGGTLAGFDIAGEDLVLRPAQARIENGNRVVVWHPQVQRPTILHYAWGSFPRCTLYSAAGLPAPPFRHLVRDRIYVSDAAGFSFKNPSFEDAPVDHPENATDWTLDNGAVRTRELASAGSWSLKLPAKNAGASQDDMARGFGSVWNCDPLLPLAVRPGCVVAYSVDMAVAGGKPVSAYLRLCQNSQAAAHEFWGGVALPMTASAQFVRRQIAAEFKPVFHLVESDVAGGRFGNQNDVAGAVYLDNFSEVTLLRPLLTVSDTSPIVLSAAPPGESAISKPRAITNGQRRTAPRQLADNPAEEVPTKLYGMANSQRTEPANRQRLTNPSDDIGAILIGKQAEFFEFVSEHRGATPQSLRFIGANESSGLRGGASPESAELVIRFKGSQRPGEYRATVRIVTQAMNAGTLSAGLRGEPPLNLYYIDLPVSVQVDLQHTQLPGRSVSAVVVRRIE